MNTFYILQQHGLVTNGHCVTPRHHSWPPCYAHTAALLPMATVLSPTAATELPPTALPRTTAASYPPAASPMAAVGGCIAMIGQYYITVMYKMQFNSKIRVIGTLRQGKLGSPHLASSHCEARPHSPSHTSHKASELI